MISPGAIKSVSHRREPTVCCTYEKGSIELTPYRDNVVHFAYFPTKERVDLPQWGFRAQPEPDLQFTATRSGRRRYFRTSHITVRLAGDTGQTTFCDADGNILVDLLQLGMEPFEEAGESCYSAEVTFGAPPDERYFGLGLHHLDALDYRGKTVLLGHGSPQDGGDRAGVPFLVTNCHYALIMDSPSTGVVAFAMDGCTSWRLDAVDAFSFFLVYGESTDDFYAAYRYLTGPTALPPKSAFGYLQGRHHYQDADELWHVARTYREKKLPCDILMLDAPHWQTLGDLGLTGESWQDSEEALKKVLKANFRLMVSCWPRVAKGSRHYDELRTRRWLMQDKRGRTVTGAPKGGEPGALIDVTNPECAQWFWEAIRDGYGEAGASAWFLARNAPDLSPVSRKLHAGPGSKVHNLYPLCQTAAVYAGHRRDREDRCLILSPSAYHGVQTHGCVFGSANLKPTWDALRQQLKAGLNFSASGMSFWSPDVGAWHELEAACDAPKKGYELRVEDEEAAEVVGERQDYLELYVRWFQLGAFSPVLRSHGIRAGNEIWSFGKDVERMLQTYLRIRYRLLPYLYSLAYETYATGAPMMRPLFMDFPDDEKVYDVEDQYMLGSAMLVAPVVVRGQSEREVYLPEGGMWYDYWTDAKHQGGQTVTVQTPLEMLPLYIRAGAIIPHAEVIEHTGCVQKRVELRVYQGADGSFRLFQDDGISYDYEQGKCQVIDIRWDDVAKTIAVEHDTEGVFARAESEWLKRIGRAYSQIL